MVQELTRGFQDLDLSGAERGFRSGGGACGVVVLFVVVF